MTATELVSVSGSTTGTVQLENADSGVTLTAENECTDGVVEVYQGTDYSYNTIDDSVVGVVISDDTDGDTLIETITETTTDLTTCTLTLSTTTYTYTGSAVTPTVTVTDADGNTLMESTDYTVEYSDNTAVTVTGIGSYSVTATTTFTIEAAADDQDDTSEQTVASATKITSAINRAKGIKLTWNAVDGTTSYQIYRKIGSGSWKKVKTTSSTT